MSQQSIGPARTPAVAIVANAAAPYRVHFHRRLARELPIRLISIFTHEISNSPWKYQDDPEIGTSLFGPGESAEAQGKAHRALHEWKKGGRIIEYLQSENVKAVIVLGYNDLGLVRIVRWCKRNQIPCYIWMDSNIHGDFASGIKAIVKKWWVRRVLRACRGCYCCGSLGQAYLEKYGADPARIVWVPCEPDYGLVESISSRQIQNVQERFGLDPARRRFVFSGRLAETKRPDLLVEAFASIASSRGAWDLVFAGDGPLRDSLTKRVNALSMQDRVRFLGFIDDQETISALYRSCDVLVLPSDYEPWALVINEAAAAGLAIVATTVVGAAAELVRSGFNGFTFPPGSVDRLKQCLMDVSEPDRIDTMKRASREVLADWRRRADPVEGVRKCLTDAGVI